MKVLLKFALALTLAAVLEFGGARTVGAGQLCDVYCGDAICQDGGCSLAGCEVPGNGCREHEGNCPEDCFGR